jgi:hypothetical protein
MAARRSFYAGTTRREKNMRKGTVVISLVVVLLSMCALAFAGDNDHNNAPPNYLTITREMTKPGVGPAHEKFETQWPAAFSKANWQTHYLAMNALTGPSESWFITGYDSAEAAEKDGDNMMHNAALRGTVEQLAGGDAQFLTGVKSMTAMYKPALSYDGTPLSIADKRYFRVAMVHVKPGHDEDFKELRTMIKDAHQKAKMTDNYHVFQVVAGAPGGTYLIFVPMKSMKEADEFDTMHDKMYETAMDQDGQKKMRELASACIESTETNFFEFSPRMSYVSKEWIAANPDFWAPKMTMSASKTKKAPDTKATKKEGAQ